MIKNAHQSAIDQANLLLSYLSTTPSSTIDIDFLRTHVCEMCDFAQAARIDSSAEVIPVNQSSSANPAARSSVHPS